MKIIRIFLTMLSNYNYEPVIDVRETYGDVDWAFYIGFTIAVFLLALGLFWIIRGIITITHNKEYYANKRYNELHQKNIERREKDMKRRF